MQFKLTSLIALTTLVSGTIAQQIVSYRGYASSVTCSGSAFGCTDGGAVCCGMPTGFGLSVQFDNLPAGTQGQGYTNNVCTAFLFALFGPGTKCFNGGGNSRATTIDWFHSPEGHARRAPEKSGNCSEPNFFEYYTADGTMRTIKVPTAKGSAQKIADLHLAKDYDSLAAYETY